MVPELTTIMSFFSKEKIIARKIFASYLFRPGSSTHSVCWQVLCCLDPWLPEPFSLRLHPHCQGRPGGPDTGVSNQNIWTSARTSDAADHGHWPLLAGAGSSVLRPDNSIASNLVSLMWPLSFTAIFFIYLFAVSKLCKHQTGVWTGLLANSSF